MCTWCVYCKKTWAFVCHPVSHCGARWDTSFSNGSCSCDAVKTTRISIRYPRDTRKFTTGWWKQVCQWIELLGRELWHGLEVRLIAHSRFECEGVVILETTVFNRALLLGRPLGPNIGKGRQDCKKKPPLARKDEEKLVALQKNSKFI